ncbi:MAG: winged helix-turn-helix transcriptional regulator [Myxococcota bacterium]
MELSEVDEAFAAPGPLFCPVARALDLIGERWILVLVRHLLTGPRGFQELRHRTGIGPRVLATRLRQMAERGLVRDVPASSGSRSLYALTDRGRELAPVVRAIATWWVEQAMEATGPFSETSAASVVEALPFLLRVERARGVHVTYELRLTGKGGGVWVVEIRDGVCSVREGFAEHADVRYTASARDWCAVALGQMDDREAHARGRLIKDGSGGSMAWYFHQAGHRHKPQEETRT